MLEGVVRDTGLVSVVLSLVWIMDYWKSHRVNLLV